MMNSVIDESAALNWCQQERSLLLRVLASFYQQYHAYLDISALSAASAQRLAHDLKSVAPSCGATALAQCASDMAPPAPCPTAAQRQILLDQLRAVLHNIKTAYPSAAALAQQPQKDSMQELRQTLDQHNLNALNMFKQWAAAKGTHWPAATIAAIQHELDNFDFKRAKQLLDSAIEKFGTTQQ